MPIELNEDDWDKLAREVERELAALTRQRAIWNSELLTGGARFHASDPLIRQKAEIFSTTGEQPRSFLRRFQAVARKDLCQPGGFAFERWNSWKDVAKKDGLKWVASILAMMGLSEGVIPTLAVAVTVYLLYLGIQAFCSDVP